MAIGIVWVCAFAIGLMNTAAIPAFQLRGIDGRGIAIELHAAFQPVVKDRRDQRPVLRDARLLFDQGSQSDGIVHPGRAMQFAPGFPEA